MENLIGYQGIFFDKETSEKLIALQKSPLKYNIENMHITFNHGNIQIYPEEIMNKLYRIKVIGYGADEENSGFFVELPEKLRKYYNNPNAPHITVSLGEVDGVKGQAVNTGYLDYEYLPEQEQFEIAGIFGYHIKEKGVFFSNDIQKQIEDDDIER